jgi:RNA polymerase sigma-70 factor, ECF subfamily
MARSAETLVGPFLGAVGHELRKRLPPAESLGPILSGIEARGRAAWPDFAVAPEPLMRQLGAQLPARGDPTTTLKSTRADDLYLACACAQGVSAAVRHLDERVLARVPRAIARVRDEPGFIEDVLQEVRRLLLVGEGAKPPVIAQYGGRGPLVHWLRVVACGTAVDHQRRTDRLERHPRTFDEEHTFEDPELEFLRKRYRDDFQAAFRDAWDALGSSERGLLRWHYRNSMSIDALATVYRVHRATAARKLARARSHLLDGIRRSFGDRLHLSPTELDSLIRVVGRDFNVTIRILSRSLENDEES